MDKSQTQASQMDVDFRNESLFWITDPIISLGINSVSLVQIQGHIS